MNFNKLAAFAVAVVIAAALSGQLPYLMRRIHIAQAKLMWEGRVSNWSPPISSTVGMKLLGKYRVNNNPSRNHIVTRNLRY